eukprot:gene1351-1951_t
MSCRSLGKVGHVDIIDLEERGGLARAAAARSFQREIILLTTNEKQAHLAVNMVANLRLLGIEHFLLLASNAELCHDLIPFLGPGGCVFSTLEEQYKQQAGAESVTSFALWTNRKYYIAELLALGYNVFQSDLDVVWALNPYPLLTRAYRKYQIITQTEGSQCPRANGGVLYVHNARPDGAAQWTIAELPRRVFERVAHPESINEIYPGLVPDIAELGTARHYIRATTDEQDLLNDVLSSSFANRTVHHRTLIMTVYGKKGKEAAESFTATHRPTLEWNSSPEGDEDDQSFRALVQSLNATCPHGPGFKSKIPHKALHTQGQRAPGTEYGVAGDPAMLSTNSKLLVNGWECQPSDPERRWERAPKPVAYITHLVGPPHTTRELLMRARGYWNYHPTDTWQSSFPMDGSKVLAFEFAQAQLLRTSSPQQLQTLMRRLAAVAAVAGRLPAIPVLDGHSLLSISDPEKIAKREVYGYQRVPCYEGKPEHGCWLWAAFFNCDKSSLVQPPELDFFAGFLENQEIGRVDLASLLSNSGRESAGGLPDGSWDSDGWKEEPRCCSHCGQNCSAADNQTMAAAESKSPRRYARGP